MMQRPPLEEATPGDQQFHCLFHRVWFQAKTPYADFAVWWPYYELGRRDMKFRTWVAHGLNE